jgi:hypothetical protein
LIGIGFGFTGTATAWSLRLLLFLLHFFGHSLYGLEFHRNGVRDYTATLDLKGRSVLQVRRTPTWGAVTC